MPHSVFRLVPFTGANTTETAALNENSGIAQTNLIRFQPDPPFGALCQKLGGWSKFYPSALSAVVRGLWAWEDLEDTAHLAFGTQIIPSTSRSELGVITNGSLADITPQQAYSEITGAVLSATVGSPYIKVNDAVTTGINALVSVYIPTHIAVGGVVLFGIYQCDPDGSSGATQYTVEARDILGNPWLATSTASAVLPVFTTVDSAYSVQVTLPNHSYGVGDTFPVLLSTIVGGITFLGNYVIQSVVDSNNFTIQSQTAATSSATGTLNNNTAVFVYNGSGNVPSSGYKIGATDWTFDNFGEDLVACPIAINELLIGTLQYQPIYLWNPDQQTATVIAEAPPVNDGVFVAMPQRQIVVWGTTETGIQDPLLIAWCDVDNPYQWIGLTTNQAGTYRIPKGSRIVGCKQGPQQALVWTDIDVWSMQYVGPPYVYSFNEIGTGCGLIGRKAAIFYNGIAYWMGFKQFYVYGGAGVEIIPCSVWDVVFQNLYAGATAASKIRAAVNSLFGEIWWFYPSAGGTGEVDSYVKYNVNLGLWDYGSLGRSAWVDQSVVGAPIGADPVSLYLYQHETSNDADGTAMLPYFQSGYFTIAEGDFKTFVDLVWPDMRWGQWSESQNAAVQITFMVADYPGDTPQTFGPYSVTQATEYFNTRFRGRLVSIKISSSDLGTWWRIGALRYRYAQDGKF